MDREPNPFWKTKSPSEMSKDEWESLCDRCGKCCLVKFEDEGTGEIDLFGVSCEYFHTQRGDCLVYADRQSFKPECVVLTPDNFRHIDWLPETCAYRLIAEGKELKWWHPLVSGDPRTVCRAGISVRDKVVSEKYVHPEDFF
jgi:uncharacterized cysteine cluster protein YcgN (CxxCxxCC family)